MGRVIMKERLREALDRKNMRQADLVAKTGIDKSQISAYLAGKYRPKQENLSLLAEALEVSEHWLLGVDELVKTEPEKKNVEVRLQAYAKHIYEERELEKILMLYRSLTAENRRKTQMYIERLLKVQEMEVDEGI